MLAMHPSERMHGPRRALITGIDSFTGPFVAEKLRARGFAVFGTTHDRSEANGGHPLDLLDFAATAALVAMLKPSHVIHLAAVSFVATADLPQMYLTNIIGSRNLLRALAESNDRPRSVIIASSANIYGNALVSPIDEDTTPRPANDYAVSKLAVEQLAQIWSARLPVTVVRPFNYTGVGQSEQFLVPKIVAAYAKGAATLQLGNLDVARDFSDVRDIAAAYAAIADEALTGTFNLCSDRVYSLADIVAITEQCSGHRLRIEVDPELRRDSEIRSLRGSNTKLRRAIPSWTCRPLEETIAWMLQEGKARQVSTARDRAAADRPGDIPT
jgi:nucleoside-diphosphate-sugar epimerase